jgi:hypothetical protein
MAIPAATIQAWAANNPQATTQQIAEVMAANGVSAEEVAQAIGSAPLPNAPVQVKKAQLQNWANSAGPYANDANTALIMRNLGLTPQEIAATSSQDAAGLQYRYDTGLASTVNVRPGSVTDDQIRTWMAGNPQATRAQMLEQLSKFQVDPEQMLRATGIDVQEMKTQQIPTGLLGYEDAINKGLIDTTKTLRDAEVSSRSDLTTAQEEVARLYGLNVADIQAAGITARDDIKTAFGKATDYFTPYQQAGTQALTMQQALSGASGQAAFDTAYQESPYIAFLRDQGMRSNLAGAAATGGLGGGNVQKELQRFGQGLASQGLQTQIGNLQNLSAQGLNAAGNAANVQTSLGTNLANVGTGTAEAVANQRGSLAGFESGTGTNLANIGQQTGVNIANFQGSAASGIASNRQRQAENLQGIIGSNAAALAGYANTQGSNLANAFQAQNTNLQNLNYNAANNYATDTQNLAGDQAGIVMGQPYTPKPVNNYGQMLGTAIQQGTSMYNLASGNNPLTGNFNPYAGNSSANSIQRGVNTMGQQPAYSMPTISYRSFS